MARRSKSSTASVSHVRRPHSRTNKYEKASANKTIHLNIRALTTVSSISSHDNDHGQQKQSKSNKGSTLSRSITDIDQFHHSVSRVIKSGLNSSDKLSSSESSQITPSQNERVIGRSEIKKNEWTNGKGMIDDFHREKTKNKKIKCTPRYVMASLIGTSIILLIIVGILLLFLIKPKSTKTVPGYIPELRWNSTGITVAGTSGMPGNASHQLNDPGDIILDYENNLYIADRKNNRIQKYLFGSQNGTTVTGSGIYNHSQYQLSNPARVIMDSNRNLYISDTSYHRIQFWPNNANYTMTTAGITNMFGNSSNQLNYPIGIALHPTSGELYISDQFNHRIMSHTFGTNFSTLLFGGNGGGTNNTKLYYPYGLHLDLFSNSLIIANTYANNIVRYVFGANTWTLVAGNVSGLAGSTSTYLNSPYEAILDPMGNLYVADRNNHRIQFFKAGQSDGVTIAGTGANGISATTLTSPRSLRLDSQLNLYVADTGNHRIQKFLRY